MQNGIFIQICSHLVSSRMSPTTHLSLPMLKHTYMTQETFGHGSFISSSSWRSQHKSDLKKKCWVCLVGNMLQYLFWELSQINGTCSHTYTKTYCYIGHYILIQHETFNWQQCKTVLSFQIKIYLQFLFVYVLVFIC